MSKRIVHITEENVFFDKLEESTDNKDFTEIMPNLMHKWKTRDFSKKIFYRMDRTDPRGGTFQYIQAIKAK